MAVTLITAPNSFNFSRNFIPLKFASDNYLEQVGVAAVNEVNFKGVAVSGTINLNWGASGVTMTAAAAPDQSGTQFPTGNGSAAYVASILPYFQANYKLSTDFDITVNGTKLVFTAKKKNYGFSFAPANNSIHQITAVTSGQPEIQRTGFAITLQLFCEKEDHSGFEMIHTTRIPVKFGTVGIAEDDIAEVLNTHIQNSYTENGPDIPDTGSLASLLCKKSARRFYFRYGESWGTDISVKKLTTSATYTVIDGGLSYVGAYLNNVKSYIVPDAADPAKDRFLRQGNNQIYTRSNQPQFLYFFNSRAAQVNAALRAKIYFTDGSAAVEKTVTTFNMDANRKYAFNVRFDVLISEDEFPGKTVERYEVWIQSSAAAKLSETRTFWIDYSVKQYVRYFLNWSSWGSLDTRLCYGKGTSQSEITQQEAKRIRKSGYDVKKGDTTIFGVKQISSFKVSTGHISRNDVVLNRDFFTSAIKYRYTAGLFLPIKVTTKQVPEIRDGETRFYQEFEYQYLFEDDAFTEGDIEEPGLSFDGFFFSSGNPLAVTNGFNETDPTVPSWVKSITQADIDLWNTPPILNFNNFIFNQSVLQEGASFYVNKGRFESELSIPHDLGSPYKVNITFKQNAGSGGTPPPPPITSLSALTDVNLTGPTNGQLLSYDSATGKWKNWTPSFTTDLSDYYNKGSINSFFSGSISIAGYNKTNWDTAFSWGNHAGAGYALAANVFDKTTADGRFLGINATAANSTKWGGLDASFIVTGGTQGDGLATIVGKHSNGYAYQFDSVGVRSFLGMPLNGDTLQSVTDRGSTTTKQVTAKSFVAQGINEAWTGKGAYIAYSTFNDAGLIGAYDYETNTWKNLIINEGGGNVGIGTTNPERKIHSVGSGVMFANNGGAHELLFGDGNSRYFGLYTPAGAGFASFRTNGVDLLTLSAGGNVGIGTTTPLYLSHVNGYSYAETLHANQALYIPHNLGSSYKVGIKFVG